MPPVKKKYPKKPKVPSKKKPVSAEDIRRFFSRDRKDGIGRKSREVKFMQAIKAELLDGKEIKVGEGGELWYRVSEGEGMDCWERYHWKDELNRINLNRTGKDKISEESIINILGIMCGMTHAQAAKFAGFNDCKEFEAQRNHTWRNIKDKGVKEVTREILGGIGIQPTDIIKPVVDIMQSDDASNKDVLAASRNLQEITGLKEEKAIHVGNNITYNIAEIMHDPEKVRLAGNQVRDFLGLPGDVNMFEGIPTEDMKALPAPVDAEFVVEG